MNSKQLLQQMMGEGDIEQMLEKYLGRSGNVGRGGGGGMRMGSSLDPSLVTKASTHDAALDAKYDQQAADAIAIAKDDTATAEIVEQYLGYENDPEYQELERQASEARASMNSGGGAGWNWATKGRYFDSLQQRMMANTAGQREIKQRYLDRMNLRLAQQEQFNPDKAKDEYNWDTKEYERVAYGSKGTRRVYGKGQMPQETVEDQYGRMVTLPKRPGTQAMVEDPTINPAYLDGESEEINTPETEAFRGGEAEVYPPMQKLGVPKSKTLALEKEASAIAENKAQEDAARALEQNRRVVTVPANSSYGTLNEDGTLGPMRQAPASPNWAPPGSGGRDKYSGVTPSTVYQGLVDSFYAENGRMPDGEENLAIAEKVNRWIADQRGNGAATGGGGVPADWTKFKYDPSMADPSDTRPLEKLGPGMGRSAASTPAATGAAPPAGQQRKLVYDRRTGRLVQQ